MLKIIEIFSYFKRKSLTNQIVIIIAAIMLVPLVALMYDIFFASRTDQVVFLDKEQRLEALLNSTNTGFSGNLESLLTGPADISSTLLSNEFTRIIEPQVPANPGIRFGLYVPSTEKITILGFMHNFRNLYQGEEAQREKDILANTKPGLKAAEMSNAPLNCIGINKIQKVENTLTAIYITPNGLVNYPSN